MAYKALYRTYRPLTFLEVAGQRHIVKTLQNALTNNKVAHAYLFTGPRGTGKTSMAKLMAKALNCEQGIGHQCNVCENCRAINDGTHPDVIEIDAASNNGVDEVRDLIDKVKYSPIKGKFKVYIIDEVHMMTSGAFNALLKTLEEPPAHVVFILATTEPHKVIPTIVSRCQRYDFAKVADNDIRDRMETILNQEKIECDPRAIDTIIELADGGVRDALSLLDQAIAYAGSSLNESDILELFGLAGIRDKIELLQHVASGATGKLMQSLEAFNRQGIDVRRLVSDLLDILKDLLIYMRTNSHKLLTKISPQEAEQLLKYLDYNLVPVYIDALLKAQTDFRYVSNIRSLFEVTLLKLCEEKDVPKQNEILKTPEEKPQVIKQQQKVTPAPEQYREEPPKSDDIVFAPINGKCETSINHVPKVAIPEVKQEEPASEKTTIFEEIEQTEPVQATIDLSEITIANLATSGQPIKIDDDNIIKIMVSGLKNDKIALLNRWSEIRNLMTHPDIGKFASLLGDGQPYVLCKQVLILEYDLQSLADKINLNENQATLQSLVKPLINRNVLIYGLTRNECVRLKRKYLELNQIKKLPERKALTISVEGYNL